MNSPLKIALLGGLAMAVGAAAYRRRMIRMPIQEFTRYALYMAVLDDDICRNELEGNLIGHTVIEFPPREESIQKRYHLFLERNRTRSRQQLRAEITDMEQRLKASRQYLGRSGEPLEVEIAGKIQQIKHKSR